MHILLVLAAHPDDAEVSAGGTMARMVEEGSTVENVLISDRSVWTGQTEAEKAAAARALGIEASPHLISALEFDDSGPTEWRLHQAATAVEEHVGSPDLIITHDLEELPTRTIASSRRSPRSSTVATGLRSGTWTTRSRAACHPTADVPTCMSR